MEKLANILKDEIPVVPETDDQTEKDLKVVELTQWEHNDELCKNYILNGLADDLYDYYNSDNKTAKQVWNALKKKYDTEEAGVKKYVVSCFLKYQMIDDKSVEAQSHEIQKIAHEIISKGMSLDEQFQIVVIIDKLPPAWEDFKNSLKHKTKEFSLESLITHLRIEEESRKQDQKDEVLLVANNKKKKFIGSVLKQNGKQLKNPNKNFTLKTNNKNGNPPKVPIIRKQG
uniref:Uncharacterized protein LOC105852727 n=1 Tax=Cicer arietinum TaxID=3827 RepID=A0A1S3EHF2_CICAR|nr:uncharacterized protein LOC105852727 [Cicer arietinum]